MPISYEKAELARQLRRDGVPVAKICRDLEMGESSFYRIWNGVTHKRPPASTPEPYAMPTLARSDPTFQQKVNELAKQDLSGVPLKEIDANSSEEDTLKTLALLRQQMEGRK